MRCIRWRLEQMNSLHQAVKGIERHHHGIRGVTPGNDRVVGIVDDLINDGFKVLARFGKVDDLHEG
jgi:hypothetical protein